MLISRAWEHISNLIMEIKRKSICFIKFIFKHSENEVRCIKLTSWGLGGGGGCGDKRATYGVKTVQCLDCGD